MKKNTYIYIIALFLIPSLWIGCSEWLEVESKDFFEKPADEYYAALREYKKTDHQITFGWFGNWSGEGTSLVNSLVGIPDSVDLVSIWGNWSNLTKAQKDDLKFFQEVKGSKALLCFIVQDIGSGIVADETRYEFWGWDHNDRDSQVAAIKKYANAICDTIDLYGYNGFDIDYEPNYGHRGDLAGNLENMTVFIEELGKRIGPKSGTDRLLVVDGEPQSIPKETGEYFDYFIVQAYYSTGDTDLNNRLNRTINNFDGVLTPEEVTNKYIVTENFEAVDVAMGGGYNFTDQYGNSMKSLEGMARWKPNNGFRKGGVGTYHMEAEYPNNPEYKNLRAAIQIMNPSSKPLVKY